MLPVGLALLFGKAFSKPELWSGDLTLPAFLTTRPLAADDLVAIRMKVAALSIAWSWLLILAFISVWIPLSPLATRSFVTNALNRPHGVLIAILAVVAAVLLTWRFLVAGLWVGFSGRMKLFIATAVPLAFSPALLVFLLIASERSDSWLRVWIATNPDGFIATLTWLAAVALIVKYALAAFSWRKIGLQRIRTYSLVWIAGTVPLVALALLLPFERLRALLVLVAFLYVPLARIGLAVISLGRHRHA